MGNCLVTKLKGSVNNDNLPIFNGKIFELETSVNNEIFYPVMPSQYGGKLVFSNKITVKDKNGNVVSNTVNTPSDMNNYLQPTTNSGGTVKIDNFDKLTQFGFRWTLKWINVIEFATCLNIVEIGSNNSNLRGEVRNLVEKQIEYGRISGNITIKGQQLTIDGVSTLEASVSINSATSYTIGNDTWNLINGVWVKQ